MSFLKLLQHPRHALNLHSLIGIHIRREREDIRFLTGAARSKRIMHHGQRAAMMLDHPFEEEAIELRALRVRQRAISSGVGIAGISVAPCMCMA